MMLTIQADDTYTTANLNWRLKLIIEIHFFLLKNLYYLFLEERVCVQPGEYWFVPITGLNWLKAHISGTQ